MLDRRILECIAATSDLDLNDIELTTIRDTLDTNINEALEQLEELFK